MFIMQVSIGYVYQTSLQPWQGQTVTQVHVLLLLKFSNSWVM